MMFLQLRKPHEVCDHVCQHQVRVHVPNVYYQSLASVQNGGVISFPANMDLTTGISLSPVVSGTHRSIRQGSQINALIRAYR